MPKDSREEKSIDEMEKEASASEDIPAPPDSDDPWAGEERKQDKFSDRDGEAKVKLYTLSIPNEPVVGGNPNPGFRKLCLDRDMAIEPRDHIRAVVLDRIMPNIAQVPYKEAKKIPKDEPWRKYLGYSFDGVAPSADKEGVFFRKCLDVDGNPFKSCSLNPGFDSDGSPRVKELGDGECPWGRWTNSLTESDREKYKIKDDDAPPMCNNNILLYCWDLDISVPFVAYFKVTTIGYAKDFLASCTRGLGEEQKQYPFYAFEVLFSVVDKGEYATAKIVNTNKFSNPGRIKPVVSWFNENRELMVRNVAVQMGELKKKAEDAGDFKPEDYE